MLRLGVIGTNWITDQFIEAAIFTKKYLFHSVYSRKQESAESFIAKYHKNTSMFTDLTEFLRDDKLQVVYIASPNSLHFLQAKQVILAGKNVIVEKPAFSNPKELEEIVKLASQMQVFFFEAARNIHEKSFVTVKKFVEKKPFVWGANFHYAKYSSRMNQVLEGEEPNIFSLKFSGGALMDLGVYLVYAAIGWFGKPRSTHYFASILSTGVDGCGTGILRYEDFDVTIHLGKNIDSFVPSEIFFSDGTLILDGINAISSAQYRSHGGVDQSLEVQALQNPMIEEASDFAKVMLHPRNRVLGKKYEEWVELARDVHDILAEMRKDAGILFAADKD
ncbi:MAG: Gfo/Idh/MocA family oxidoreductase [Lactobacillales bacterium]|jgi:predicted dehydrogenase|nr:Gfo/Idh/MocA family oxidoreductase [Lactobacillales bacterium]